MEFDKSILLCYDLNVYFIRSISWFVRHTKLLYSIFEIQSLICLQLQKIKTPKAHLLRQKT